MEKSSNKREYCCHRCKKPGHRVQDCPTRGDRNYDKRTFCNASGVPRGMMTLLSTEEAFTRKDAFRLSDGTFGLHRGAPERMNALKAYATQVHEKKSLIPPQLVCPLCTNVLRDAMKIKTCCNASFCSQCITPDYGESQVHCPLCKRSHRHTALVIDDEARRQVNIYEGKT